jgi:isoaspartyl peptidase/L-asparaginase-like protein (Ntn-hydrolase superfamily)
MAVATNAWFGLSRLMVGRVGDISIDSSAGLFTVSTAVAVSLTPFSV